MSVPTPKFVFKHPLIHFLDWAILIAIFAFAGSLSRWSSITTRPFLVVSTATIETTASEGIDVSPLPTSPYSMGIAYPYRKDTISTTSLMLISILIPLLYILLHSTILSFSVNNGLATRTTAKWKFMGKYVNTALLGLAASVSFTLLVTEGLKSVVGKQRPDFMGRCGKILAERIGKYTTTVIADTRMVTWEVCENYWTNNASKERLKDGWRSFPSGHASISFAGLIYLAFYICDIAFRLLGPLSLSYIHKTRRPSDSTAERPVVALFIMIVPILIALYVSATRYTDLKHEGIDIFCGAIIGMAGALLGWNWYGPKLVQQLTNVRNTGCDLESFEKECQSKALAGGIRTLENQQSIQKTADVDVIEVIVD